MVCQNERHVAPILLAQWRSVGVVSIGTVCQGWWETYDGAMTAEARVKERVATDSGRKLTSTAWARGSAWAWMAGGTWAEHLRLLMVHRRFVIWRVFQRHSKRIKGVGGLGSRLPAVSGQWPVVSDLWAVGQEFTEERRITTRCTHQTLCMRRTFMEERGRQHDQRLLGCRSFRPRLFKDGVKFLAACADGRPAVSLNLR